MTAGNNDENLPTRRHEEPTRLCAYPRYTHHPREQLAEQHQRFLAAATTDNTRRTYRSAIRHFLAWGGVLPCDEAALIRYLLSFAEVLNRAPWPCASRRCRNGTVIRVFLTLPPAPPWAKPCAVLSG
ncbi:hypothetical protein [Pseudomonas aeruginosa]|uniref:hypothetical protein n=1 Tax=Pseudomonas aeruginosa TaxID=287 RepID=UPI0033065B06